MSNTGDTNTTGTSGTESGTTKVKRSATPRSVTYGLEVFDALPEGGGFGPRTSPFEEAIVKIKADTALHGKPVCIAKYNNDTAGGAAANVLRQRHGGTPAVEGFTFASRKIDGGQRGLFVIYEPGKIVAGADVEWEATEKARKAAVDAKRAAKNGTGNGTSTPAKADAAPAPADKAPAASAKAPAATAK